jgi:hypothetical protein
MKFLLRWVSLWRFHFLGGVMMKDQDWAVYNESEIKQIVNRVLDSLPEDTDRIASVDALKYVCQGLSYLDEVTANTILRAKLKQLFGMTSEEIKEFQKLTAEYRSAIRDKSPEPRSGVERLSGDFPALIDIVRNQDGQPTFLVKASGSVMLSESQIDGETLLLPPPKEKLPFPLTDGSQVMRHFEAYTEETARNIDSQLYDDLLQCYKSASALPHEGAYHVLVTWTLHTYLLEKAFYSPFILFFGMPSRGKTTTGKAMTYLAYRGLHIESLNAAHLIRVTRDLRASIFVDVRDIVRKLKSQQSGDLILLRYERGAQALRVLRPALGAYKDLEYYPVFGPTVFATNEPMDDILSGRTIPIPMPPTTMTFPKMTPQSGLPLRERLLAFRAWHLGDELSAPNSPFQGRFQDIVTPLLQMAQLAKPEYLELVTQYLGTIQEQKNIEALETLEVRIVCAVIELGGSVRNGRLPVKAITERINREKDTRSRIDSSLIGRKLKALGFTKAKTGTGCISILWDTEMIRRLAAQMELPPDPPDPPYPRSQSSAREILKRLRKSR